MAELHSTFRSHHQWQMAPSPPQSRPMLCFLSIPHLFHSLSLTLLYIHSYSLVKTLALLKRTQFGGENPSSSFHSDFSLGLVWQSFPDSPFKKHKPQLSTNLRFH